MSDWGAKETDGKVLRLGVQEYWADSANAIWGIYIGLGWIYVRLWGYCLSFIRKAERETHEGVWRVLRQDLARAEKEDEI